MRLSPKEYDALIRLCSLTIPNIEASEFKSSLVSIARKAEQSRDAKAGSGRVGRRGSIRAPRLANGGEHDCA